MKLTKPVVLLFIGTVGSGKGTQVDLLNQALKLPVVTMGDVFRTERERDTDRGRAIREIYDRGDLIPPNLWEPALRDYLQELNCSQGALFDGVLRSIAQTTAYQHIESDLLLPPILVINIDVPIAEALKRLLARGRDMDKSEEATKRRLDWSRSETEPVVEHYRSLDKVIDINGDQSIDAVHAEIVQKLAEAGVITNA